MPNNNVDVPNNNVDVPNNNDDVPNNDAPDVVVPNNNDDAPDVDVPNNDDNNAPNVDGPNNHDNNGPPQINVDSLPPGPITDLLRGGPTSDDLLNRVKQAGLMAQSRMCCNNVCVWRHYSGVDGWRWRCNSCRKTILPRKNSPLFHKSCLAVETILVLLIQWLASSSIAEAATAARTSRTAVSFFAAKMKKFAHRYIYRHPHQFNRNPTAVVEVGRCRGGGNGDCVYILICTNTVAVLFHNKNHRYTQRKVLPLLPDTDFIYTDNILYRLPDGCHHSPIDDCPFDRTAKVRDASAYIKSKRGLKCDGVDQVCAEYNYRYRFGHLDMQQEFLLHYQQLHAEDFR